MKIAVLGTRGIPNNHGGFEQFAEYFSLYLHNQGHETYVYNSHLHPYQESSFKGVNIIHCFDPEYKIGTAGQFIYDYNCIKDSKKRDFDVILQLGYTSSSIWNKWLPKKPVIVTNMDGMEWKRSKYAAPVQKFLKYAEKLAVKSSDFLISDSVGIQDYIKQTYNRQSEFIAYGANIFENANELILDKYNLKKHAYSIIIARLEPENNIETILDGYHESKTPHNIIIFGGLNAFGLGLQQKYKSDKRINFLGANYNQDDLNNLRHFSRYYFHGHSVGGTNPSLLEAMASNALIVANDNIFNKSILNENAIYFKNAKDIKTLIDADNYFDNKTTYTALNLERIKESYSWEKINSQYEKFLIKCIQNG